MAGGGNTPGISRSEDLVGWNATGRHLRAGMCGLAAIVVGVTAYWGSRAGQSVARAKVTLAASPARAAQHEISRFETAQADIASAPAPVPPPAADTEESTIAQYTAEKYQLLLDDIRQTEAGQVEQLSGALLEREKLAGDMYAAGQKEALARAEERIRGMLHAADYATYEALKESDLEQFRLNEYAGGIANVAPLDAADRKSILRTKLAYKQRFRQLVQDSGLEREALSPAEREYAYSVASRALEIYQRDYLGEVRQYLASEEQFALLRNYEATEFKTELDRLHGGS